MKSLPTDHRVRVTKMLIRKAFTELLNQKPIQCISIKELCERAGINRGTFYAHYTDIYDLLHQIEDEMLVDFQAAIAPLLADADQENGLAGICYGIFQCLKDNSDLCIVTLGDYGDKAFVQKLLNIGRDICLKSYLQYFKTVTPKQIEYYYAFVSDGCLGLLRRWLEDGMTMPTEEVARLAEGIMLHGLGFLEQ